MEAKEKLSIRVELLELAREVLEEVRAEPALISARIHVHPETRRRFVQGSAPIGRVKMRQGAPPDARAHVAALMSSAIYKSTPEGDRFLSYPVVEDPDIEPGRVRLVAGPRKAVSS